MSVDSVFPASGVEVGGGPRAGFVGRGEELAVLRGLVAGVAAGRGGVVWVEGEPGIGKSVLIEAEVGGAELLGCQVFWGSATELQVVPLQPLLDALRVGRGSVDAARAPLAALLRGDGLGGVATPRDVAAMLAEHVLILVDRLCAAAPVVLVLDDVQWADEASLSVWSRLGATAAQAPLLVIAACRPVPSRAAVDAVRRDLVTREARLLQLGGLPPTQVVEMVAGLVAAGPGGRLGQRLGVVVTQAAGNPLYVRELVDALVRDERVAVVDGVAELMGAGPLPDSLPAAVQRRLSFLSERVRSVLRLAVLFGPTFSVADLGAVTGQPATDLISVIDEAVGAGVLAGSGDRLVFRHGLIRQALYEGMPASLRAALHRQAAQALARVGVPVELVAQQLLAGPQEVDGWTVEWVAGSASALTMRAPGLAVELLRRVRDAVDGPDPRRERLDADLADALLTLGEYDQLEQLAYPVLTSTGDPVLAGRMGWAVGYALQRMGRNDRAVDVIEQALARPGLPSVWAGRLRAVWATGLANLGRYHEARAAAAQAEADGHQAGDRQAIGHALHTLAWTEYRQNLDIAASAAILDRALAVVGDDPQTTDLRLLLLTNTALNQNDLGRPTQAQRTLGQALILAEQAGAPPRLGYVRLQVAQTGFYWGSWDEALAELEAADDQLLTVRNQTLARGIRALIAVHRNDREAADAQMHGVSDLTLHDPDLRLTGQLLVWAWALAAGEPAQALARLLRSFDPEGRRQFPERQLDSWEWLLDVVRLATTIGDTDTAAAAAQACATDIGPQPRPAAAAAVQHCQGLVERDPVQLHAAADTFHRLNLPLFHAQALEDAAVLHAEQGNSLAARTAYLAAINMYADLDAAWDIVRADARLRRHDIRRGRRGPRRRPATGWESLTPSEQKIAHLVAAGQSNPDIAAQLFLSRRTVETHVSHILAKLRANSRIDIARELSNHRAT